MFERIKITGLRKSFGIGGSRKDALKSINLTISKGECLGLVGESGCGKTTLARCLLGLQNYDTGEIVLSLNENGMIKDSHFSEISAKERNLLLRTYLQYIFQNPGGSLHPRRRIGKILRETHNDISRLTKRKLPFDIPSILEMLSLEDSILSKVPDSLSGGEKQRVSIARSLLAQPSLLIADEPLSNMDVTTQKPILDYFRMLNRQKGIAIIFITHDLSTVRELCDSIAIMKEGKIIEQQENNLIFSSPIEPYTKELTKMYKRISCFD